MTKHLPCPQRLRQVPRQFSWIDQRLVRDGHLARCGGPPALALYLLLVTAADGQGLSYYSDRTSARLLGLPESELRAARRALLEAGLIAYAAPLYQVLSLDPAPAGAPPSAPRAAETLPIAEVLRRMFESGGPKQP
jgi:hypothetical protein